MTGLEPVSLLRNRGLLVLFKLEEAAAPGNPLDEAIASMRRQTKRTWSDDRFAERRLTLLPKDFCSSKKLRVTEETNAWPLKRK